MDTSLRQKQIELLEQASEQGIGSPPFEAVLTATNLTEAYGDILSTVLARGRWRSAAFPMDHVRRRAVRGVFKEDEDGKDPREKNNGYSAIELEWMAHAADSSGAIRMKNSAGRMVWRNGGGEREDADIGMPTPVRRIRQDFIVETGLSDSVDWGELARRAALDEGQTQALALRANGYTLYGALQLCENDLERRALEAAWKRLERSGLKKLRPILFY